MKSVTASLANHLNTVKNFVSCDLITITLGNVNQYHYTNTDRAIVLDGITYKHDGLLFKRQQTKLNDRVVVDTMTVSISANSTDKI